LQRPATSKTSAGGDQSIRPMTQSGLVTGYARPGTQSRLGTGQAGGGASVDQAFKGSRPGTSRPMTALGRQVRLGTASMRSDPTGAFINPDRLDMRKYAQRQTIAKVWNVGRAARFERSVD
jgi:tetratricopeptide repeat protein 8